MIYFLFLCDDRDFWEHPFYCKNNVTQFEYKNEYIYCHKIYNIYNLDFLKNVNDLFRSF